MTVSTTSNRIVYTGNGSTTAFAFPYKFIATADLKVYVAGVLQTTGYTVGAPSDTGANVTFSSAPANGAAIIILSDPARLQATSLPSTGPFPAKSVETMADKLTLLVQRLYDLASRSFTLSDADTATVSTTLPTPAANNIIGWNGSANGLQNVPLADLATSIAYGTARSDIFTGDGTTKTFTLSATPGAQANLDVAIAGVTQLPGTDYTWSTGTSLVFASAPPNGAKILARYMQGLAQGASDSASAAFIQSGTGAVSRDMQSKGRELDVSPEDFGAVGDGITDDSAAVLKAVATGKRINGNGKTYKVVGNTIIDPYATAGVGYGLNKAWFCVGPCRDINFVGNVSFGNLFLPKGSQLSNVSVTGDARFSTWYSTFSGFVVTGNTYFGGDYPPSTNWNGFYYNTFTGCNFNNVIVDQRYGPVNLNTFLECRFTNYHIVYTGNTGYGGGTLPIQSHHMNRYINCEWYDTVGITAPDGNKYVMVADANTVMGGVNTFDGVYNESTIMGFYLLGVEISNIHFSGNTGPAFGGGDIAYNTPLSGEGGWVAGDQRDVPHIYPAGNMLVGGDWSVLNSSGYPYCLTPNLHTVTTGTDTQEPTGLGKYVQFAATAGFATVSINFGAADGTNRTLRSFAMVYKVTAGTPGWEVQDSAGNIVYGAVTTTNMANGWVIAYGHTYGIARLAASGTYTVKVSAVSAGRGAGVVSPVTNQPGGKPLLDLSGGASLMDDFIAGSGKIVYSRSGTKTMQTSSGNVDWFSIDFGAFTGRVAQVRAVFGLASGGGGARVWYRESVINETGGATLTEQNLHAVAGANGSLSFSLSGAVLTVRTTSVSASAETARLAIEVIGYEMNASRITVL